MQYNNFFSTEKVQKVDYIQLEQFGLQPKTFKQDPKVKYWVAVMRRSNN